MACCYEALGRGEAALAMYREFIRIPNGPLRLSAVCNVAKLLTERGDCDKAYDVVANTLLLCPADERRGPAWGTMLRILAELEIGRGRLDVALIAVEDALEFIPENRPAALAKAHGVRALAKCSVGDVEEAKEALELAWSLACESCSEDAGEFLKRIEGLISGGDS
jgi:tetratricopeptide (TPR) repeat protein